jgi:glutamine cyclotransferase
MMLRNGSLFGLVFIFFLLSCKEEKKQSRGIASSKVKNVRINFLNAEGAKVHYGDTLQVKLEFDADTLVTGVTLYTQRGNFKLSDAALKEYKIPTAETGGGYHGLRAEVMLADSTLMRGSASFRVVLPSPPAAWDYRLIAQYPHDENSYTQGLLYDNGVLYESAGRYSQSDIRTVNWQNGNVLSKKQLSNDYFAEGLALKDNQLFQLTWREQMVFVYQKEDLSLVRSFGIEVGNGEGWGLAWNGTHFILSDGSADLYFLNPDDWSVSHSVRVFDHQGDVLRINELEYVDGWLYANVLDREYIAVIDPESGAVQAYWNFEGILDKKGLNKSVDVMNGIAFRPDGNSFFITGKLWPFLFEVAPVYQ